MRYRLFQKTESLITADGSDDDLIKPESLTNYKILPPVLYPQSAAPISSVSHDFEQEEQDELPDDFEVEGKNFKIMNQKEEG